MTKYQLKIKEESLISIDELLNINEKISNEDNIKEYYFISKNENIIINIMFITMDGFNKYFAFINKDIIKYDDGHEYSFIMNNKIFKNKYDIENMHSLKNILNNPIIKNEIRLNKLKRVCSKLEIK